MAQYRKKPVVIEAVQFTREMVLEQEPLAPGLVFRSKSLHPGRGEIYHYKYGVETLEGFMEASIGDWIIKGVNGEFYPCKPDIFEKTYEAIHP
jgi:hypothetical protein